MPPISLFPDTIVLICSDGLTNMIEDNEIGAILKERGSLEEKAGRLVAAANDNGGKDKLPGQSLRPVPFPPPENDPW